MAGTYALWFRKTYQLAPTDPRFLAATEEEIEAEFWAYHFEKKGAAGTEEFSDEDFNLDEVLAEIDAEGEAASTAAPAPVAAVAVPMIDPSQVDDWEEVPDA